MKTKILKVKDFDNTLKDNSWTPEEYYKLFDSPADNYNLVKGAPLCYRIDGMFISEKWLYNHIIGFFDKMYYNRNPGYVIFEWIFIR